MGLPIIDHHITKDKAKEIRDKYQSNNPGKIRRFAFDAKQVQEVLDQAGCTHVAIYPASKDDGTDTVVVAALDANTQELSGVMLEEAMSCPPFC
jgi:sialic acid synthase SpsE